jgi:hypothetical protein
MGLCAHGWGVAAGVLAQVLVGEGEENVGKVAKSPVRRSSLCALTGRGRSASSSDTVCGSPPSGFPTKASLSRRSSQEDEMSDTIARIRSATSARSWSVAARRSRCWPIRSTGLSSGSVRAPGARSVSRIVNQCSEVGDGDGVNQVPRVVVEIGMPSQTVVRRSCTVIGLISMRLAWWGKVRTRVAMMVKMAMTGIVLVHEAALRSMLTHARPGVRGGPRR